TGMCFLATPCGQDGQRACCNGAGEFYPGTLGPCAPGLVQLSGTCGSGDPARCVCSTSRAPFPAYSLGTCVQITPCGGPVQRACSVGEGPNGFACNPGLVQLPGTCGPGNPNCLCSSGAYSLGVCVPTAPCGDAGQRACCIGFGEFSKDLS